VPIIEVSSPLWFALKIVSVVVLANSVGAGIYAVRGRTEVKEPAGLPVAE